MSVRSQLLVGLITLACLVIGGCARHTLQNHPPLQHLKSFDLSTPLVHHDLSDAVDGHHTRVSTLASGGAHSVHRETATLSTEAFGQKFVLSLEKNVEAISGNFVVMDGQHNVVQRGIEHCYYKGRVNGKENSVVVLHTCGNGIDGFFSVDGETYVVSPLEQHDTSALDQQRLKSHPKSTDSGLVLAAQHLVYRLSDIGPNVKRPGPCGVGLNGDHNHEEHDHEHEHEEEHDSHDHAATDAMKIVEQLRQKRRPGSQTVVLGEGEPVLEDLDEHSSATSRKLLQTTIYYTSFMFVNDARQVTAKTDASGATEYAVFIANAVNTLYGHSSLSSTVRVVVTLSAVSNLAESDITVNGATVAAATAAQRSDSNYFSSYLSAFSSWAAPQIPETYDNAQLLTGWSLSGGVAGVAYVGAMCAGSSVGVNEDSSGSSVWTVETVTHEMGHNFGSQHDSSAGNSCTASGFIMAAIGSICRSCNVSSLTWSTCSATYIDNFIQNMSPTRQCLTDQPVPLGSVAVCGDFLVTGDEQCDIAASPGICGPDCRYKSGVQCTTGPCCNPLTGHFKGSGTLCRASAGDCDVPDYCDGTQAQCPTDLFAANGSPCNDNRGTRCQNGQCLSFNQQCRDAVQEFLGASTGTVSNCPASCGDLSCKRSNSAACAVIPVPLDGGGSSGNVQVSSGTPGCTGCPSGTCICSGTACVDDPGVSGCGVNCNATGHGECTNTGTCSCNAGWAPPTCTEQQPCSADCAGAFREQCIPANSLACGPCLDGRATVNPDNPEANAPCYLRPPNVVFAASADSSGANPENALDNDPNTQWTAQVNSSASSFAHLIVVFERPVYVEYYTIQVANSVAEDPRDWALVGGSSAAGPWDELDVREGQAFEQRLQTKSFQVRKPNSYPVYALQVRETQNAGTSTHAVRVSTFALYEDDSPAESLVTAFMASVLVVTFVALIGIGVMSYMKRSGKLPKFCFGQFGAGSCAPNGEAPVKKVASPAPVAVSPQPAAVPVFQSSPVNVNAVPQMQPQHTRGPSLPPRDYPASQSTTSPVGETGEEAINLPPGWEMFQTEQGVPYYWNESTQQSSWEVPAY